MSFGRLLLLALACLLVLAGCGPASGQRTAPTTAAPIPTDVPGLSRFINLPVQPVQVQWQVNEKGSGDRMAIGPTDIELVAVLRLDPQGLQALRSQLTEQTGPAELFVAPDFVQPWFPASIQRRFVADPAHPDLLRLAGVRYEPAPFARDGLSNGYVLLAEDTVFIYLHSM